MLIDLTDVLTTEGKTEEKRIIPELDSFQYQGNDYKVLTKEPFILTLLGVEKGKARVTGEAKLTIQLFCDRCLQEVPHTFVMPLECILTADEGSELDAESLLHDEIIVNWPMKILCREDCKGICSVCGQNLNHGACGCDTFVPDPRMAKIQEIFYKGKEV